MKKAKMIVPLLLLAGLDDLQVDRKEEHQQLALQHREILASLTVTR